MAYPQPPASHVLQELITKEYPRLGLNHMGLFIGAPTFKERLAEEYPEYPINTITPVLKAMLKLVPSLLKHHAKCWVLTDRLRQGALPLTTKLPVPPNVRKGRGKGNPVPVGKGNGNPGPIGRETAVPGPFESLDKTKWIQEKYFDICREPDGTLASRQKIERTLIEAIPAGPKKRTRMIEDLILVFLRDTFRAEEERGERSPKTTTIPIYPNAKIAGMFIGYF